jgi:hypothetical protein
MFGSDFITKINDSFNAGYQWYKDIEPLKIQGAFAMLDAMSEEINNNIYGKGHVLLVCLLGYGF